MFGDLSRKLHNNFIGKEVLDQLPSKRERICHIIRKFDMNGQSRILLKKVEKISKRHSKNEARAEKKFQVVQLSNPLGNPCVDCNDVMRELNNVSDLLVGPSLRSFNILLVQVILLCDYSNSTFLDAFDLRSKLFAKIGDFRSALGDIEVVAKYGGWNADRIVLKAICYYSIPDSKQLRDLIKSVNFENLELSETFVHELKQMKLGHLSIKRLIEKVNNPAFVTSTIKPSIETKGENPLDQLKVIDSQYRLDPRCEIVKDLHKGRHFMAKQEIAKGTYILVERSYSIVLDKTSIRQRCLNCYKQCASFVPCLHCVDAIFCNEKCFQSAWNLFHKYECTIITAFKDSLNAGMHMYRSIMRIGYQSAIQVKEELARIAKTPVDMTDKVLDKYMNNDQLRLKAECDQSHEQRLDAYRMVSILADHNEKFESYYDVAYMGLAIDVALLILLCHHLDQTNQHDATENDDIFQTRPIFKGLEYSKYETLISKRKTNKLPTIFGYEDFLELVQIIQLNLRKLSTNVFSWNVYRPDYSLKESVASCQCLIGSFINHSCDPNVEWDFVDGFIVYKTTR